MNLSIIDFFSKCDQIHRKIWTYLQKKYLMENFIFCAFLYVICAARLYEQLRNKVANDWHATAQINFLFCVSVLLLPSKYFCKKNKQAWNCLDNLIYNTTHLMKQRKNFFALHLKKISYLGLIVIYFTYTYIVTYFRHWQCLV